MKLKLWRLEMIDGALPWIPWYDKVSAQVVIAETEKRAREVAAIKCGPEGRDAWLNNDFSTCQHVQLSEECVVLASEMWA